MSGDLNVFDKRVGDKPASVLHVSALHSTHAQTADPPP